MKARYNSSAFQFDSQFNQNKIIQKFQGWHFSNIRLHQGFSPTLSSTKIYPNPATPSYKPNQRLNPSTWFEHAEAGFIPFYQGQAWVHIFLDLLPRPLWQMKVQLIPFKVGNFVSHDRLIAKSPNPIRESKKLRLFQRLRTSLEASPVRRHILGASSRNVHHNGTIGQLEHSSLPFTCWSP